MKVPSKMIQVNNVQFNAKSNKFQKVSVSTHSVHRNGNLTVSICFTEFSVEVFVLLVLLSLFPVASSWSLFDKEIHGAATSRNYLGCSTTDIAFGVNEKMVFSVSLIGIIFFLFFQPHLFVTASKIVYSTWYRRCGRVQEGRPHPILVVEYPHCQESHYGGKDYTRPWRHRDLGSLPINRSTSPHYWGSKGGEHPVSGNRNGFLSQPHYPNTVYENFARSSRTFDARSFSAGRFSKHRNLASSRRKNCATERAKFGYTLIWRNSILYYCTHRPWIITL